MRLVDLLNEHGKNWKIIEELLGDRTQNQIKNRYFGRLKRISDKKIALKDKAKAEALEGGNHWFVHLNHFYQYTFEEKRLSIFLIHQVHSGKIFLKNYGFFKILNYC